MSRGFDLPCCMQPLSFLRVQLCTLCDLSAAQLLLPPTSSFLPFKLTLHFSCLYIMLVLFKVRKDVMFLLHM